MSVYVDRLITLRMEAVDRQRALMAQAETEKRDLSPEELANVDATDKAITDYGESIAHFQEMDARALAADTVRDTAGKLIRTDRQSSRKDPTDAEIIMAIASGGEVRGREYNKGAGGYLFEERSLAPDTTNMVGATISQSFYDQVQVYQRTLNPTYDLATVIKTRTGAPIVIPRLTADQTTYTPGYGTAITPSDPTISSITLNAYGYKSLTLWAQELDEDEAINLEQLIARTAGRDIGIQAGSAFTLGSGTGEPKGFITACTNGGTAAGTPFLNGDDLMSLFYSLAQPYRLSPGAAWQVSNSALQKMRKAKDTVGQYLWVPSLLVGTPDMFLGKPVRENPAMSAVASASKSVAFGDFSAYIIREVNGFRVDRSTDYAFNTDQVALKTVWRVDGNLPDALAIKYLVSYNS